MPKDKMSDIKTACIRDAINNMFKTNLEEKMQPYPLNLSVIRS